MLCVPVLEEGSEATEELHLLSSCVSALTAEMLPSLSWHCGEVQCYSKHQLSDFMNIAEAGKLLTTDDETHAHSKPVICQAVLFFFFNSKWSWRHDEDD